MQQLILNGTISLSEIPSIPNKQNKNNKPNYIITSLINNKPQSMTQILDTIFTSKNTNDKLIEVKLVEYITGIEHKGFGKLIIGRESYNTKVESYFVGNFSLEKKLFELLDTNVEMTLVDLTDSIGEFLDNNNINSTGTSEDMHNDKVKAM
ncbi:MAG TPA: hypothetical protein DEG71_02460 [Clostridiales bacterium]|nr:hypothetical protein [Clostridiales bacterium]